METQKIRDCYCTLGELARFAKTAEVKVEAIATLVCRGRLANDDELVLMYDNAIKLINEIASKAIQAREDLANAGIRHCDKTVLSG